MLKIGATLNGRYYINGLIGKGGMSFVYSATDNFSGAVVAIKEAIKNSTEDKQTVQLSLAAEGRMLKSLSNPHLPKIYDVIETAESIMIVMDYVEGESLDKLVRRNGVIDASTVIEWGIQICEVLEYLHMQTPPIIYRDMKPANVILRPDGFLMMVDFGTARKWTSENRTSDTILIGTEGFAAPEQYGGMGQSDARTDVFCLGATLFNLVTGHNPYEKPYGVGPLGTWNAALEGTPIDKLIQKCTANNPNERFQSAGELMDALIDIRGNTGNTITLSKFRIGLPKKNKGWQTSNMEKEPDLPVKSAGVTRYDNNINNTGISDEGNTVNKSAAAAENITFSEDTQNGNKAVSDKGSNGNNFNNNYSDNGNISVNTSDAEAVVTNKFNQESLNRNNSDINSQIGNKTDDKSTDADNASGNTNKDEQDNKSTWRLIMIAAFAGVAVIIILGIVVILVSGEILLLPVIIMLVLLAGLAVTGIFALTKCIK